MKTNVKRPSLRTHEDGKAKHVNAELQLRRSVMSCLLFEREFYEEGEDIATRIAGLIPKVDAAKVAAIAIEAREKMKLRHIPLFIVREMVRHPEHKKFVRATLAQVIQRPDELTEFLALYWKEKRTPIAKQVRLGLADAFPKFSEYQLGKYNRDEAIKLRDVLFLCHAKPKDKEQEAVWKKLVNGTLATPDTWEVALSAGKDKLETWQRLLAENKLGALALLRNLRNMQTAKVPDDKIREALKNMKTERVLPFRFISAARFAPHLEPELEEAMLKCLTEKPQFKGETMLLVDVSGSMDQSISGKSDLQRVDAACGLAMLAREVCEKVRIYSFSSVVKEIPARRGFALRDALLRSQPHGSTYLGQAVSEALSRNPDRLIVISDEQTADPVPDAPKSTKAYMLNVASAKNGVGYGSWLHIDGWSESVIDYLAAVESADIGSSND